MTDQGTRDALRALDPTLLPTEAELAATAKEAEARIAAHVQRGAEAFLAFERLLRTEVTAQITASEEQQAAEARAETNVAREKLLEYVTHPLLVSRDAREDDAQEIAYLRETCRRQQKELSSLRESTSSLAGQRADLEASCRVLRLDAEDLARKLAKAQEMQESPEHAWPVFEENGMVRFYGSSYREVDVPFCAGDNVATVAKAIATRLSYLRARTR